MCGICGLIRLRADAPELDLEELRAVRGAMASRGPDGEGEWLDAEGVVALGHRRLAILDLTVAGAQPMSTPDGRFRLVFNGEIYNFRELRRELEQLGERFRSDSDTEVVLALWAREGSRALSRLRGMFALALWDAERRVLTLARDPFGIKPLYYGVADGVLRFASQVRALEAGGRVSREIEPAALVGFLLWGSVPEPWTLRRGLRALRAGHLLEVHDGRVGEPRAFAVDAPELPNAGGRLDPESAVIESVRAHLVSDVPVAVFLSAGLDSALVASIAARELGEALTTFTLTFDGWQDTARDEGPLARRVSALLGTRHVERRLGAAEIAAAWPRALAAMDQPSIDGFNSYLVARAAHDEGIRVALSGLGGDELFGSYPSFRDVPAWRRQAGRLRRLPGLESLWPALARRLVPGRPKLAGLLRYGATLEGSYLLRRGLFLPEELAALIGPERAAEGLGAYDPLADGERNRHGALFTGPADRLAPAWVGVQRLETSHYLRNQLLRDTDWAAMASSVEVRVPFVDVPLWRAMASAGFEPARSRGKAAIARRVAPDLPAEIWNRPKSGFGVPSPGWFPTPERTRRSTAGGHSRGLALALLEEFGACPGR